MFRGEKIRAEEPEAEVNEILRRMGKIGGMKCNGKGSREEKILHSELGGMIKDFVLRYRKQKEVVQRLWKAIEEKNKKLNIFNTSIESRKEGISAEIAVSSVLCSCTDKNLNISVSDSTAKGDVKRKKDLNLVVNGQFIYSVQIKINYTGKNFIGVNKSGDNRNILILINYDEDVSYYFDAMTGMPTQNLQIELWRALSPLIKTTGR